jgi:hypothetical protein
LHIHSRLLRRSSTLEFPESHNVAHSESDRRQSGVTIKSNFSKYENKKAAMIRMSDHSGFEIAAVFQA